MVVVLILGILLAIALPTFIGARTRAEEAAAKSSLRVALTAGRVIYATSSARDPNGRYLDATIPELQLLHVRRSTQRHAVRFGHRRNLGGLLRREQRLRLLADGLVTLSSS